MNSHNGTIGIFTIRKDGTLKNAGAVGGITQFRIQRNRSKLTDWTPAQCNPQASPHLHPGSNFSDPFYLQVAMPRAIVEHGSLAPSYITRAPRTK